MKLKLHLELKPLAIKTTSSSRHAFMGDGGKELRLNLVYINGQQLIVLKHMESG